MDRDGRRARLIAGVVAVLVVSGATLAVTVSAQTGGTCGGSTPTIHGTKRGDHIKGTTGDDVIDGRSGNDTIDGRGGNDTICGGAGNDHLLGGGRDDPLIRSA